MVAFSATNRCPLRRKMLWSVFREEMDTAFDRRHVFTALPLHTSAKHALFAKHVFHAEPLHTSAKHARARQRKTKNAGQHLGCPAQVAEALAIN